MESTLTPLAGVEIVITRPSASACSLVRRVRALGGQPRRLPGLSLRALPASTARATWVDAQHDDVLIFSSPAAARFALRLAPLHTRARVLAIGRGTCHVLWRAGCTQAQSPPPGGEHSEGLLQHPWLRDIAGCNVRLITAAGGRGLLAATLTQRGAKVGETHVYERIPPRLNRRHVQMVQALRPSAWLLVTSMQALDYLLQWLPSTACHRLRACRVVVSSARLQRHVRAAGFVAPVCAVSAAAADLLAVVVADQQVT